MSPTFLLRFGACWLALLLLLAGPARLVAAPQWKVLPQARFTVVSQLSEKHTRAWADEFSLFLGALRTEITPEERLLAPLTVVLFARDKDFDPYRPRRPDGDPFEAAGVFVTQETWATIGMVRGFDDEITRHTIFHEGVHWYMNSMLFKAPHWLHEGIAEVFSTFEVEGAKMRWGEPVPAHVFLLRRTPPLPIEKLLAVRADDKLFNDDARIGLYYAESWALTHYLMFGQRQGEGSALHRYLLEWNQAEAKAGPALLRALGTTYAELDRTLAAYMEGGKYLRLEVPRPAQREAPGAFVDATPAAVEAALARLALGTHRFELAQRHAEAVVRLDPHGAVGYELLTWLAAAREEEAEAARYAALALEHASRDAWTLVVAASAALKDVTHLAPSEARQIANRCELAINRRPNLRAAYQLLVQALSFLEKVPDQDLEFIQQGRRLFPEEGTLPLFQAQIARRRGDHARAIRLLHEAQARRDSFSLTAWPRIARLEEEWNAEDGLARVERLLQEQQIKEAGAEIERLAAQNLGGLETTVRIQAARRWITFELALQDVLALAAAGERERASARLAALARDFPGPEWQARLRSAQEGLALLPTPAAPSAPGR